MRPIGLEEHAEQVKPCCRHGECQDKDERKKQKSYLYYSYTQRGRIKIPCGAGDSSSTLHDYLCGVVEAI